MSDLTPEQREEMRARVETLRGILLTGSSGTPPFVDGATDEEVLDRTEILVEDAARLLDALDETDLASGYDVMEQGQRAEHAERQRDDALEALREIGKLGHTGLNCLSDPHPNRCPGCFARQARERIERSE